MDATLKIRSTTVVEIAGGFVVDLTLASEADLELASDLVQIHTAFGTDEKGPRLVALQRVVLERVQIAIAAEIQRLLRFAADTR
jgi:hypothetical protein